MIQLSDGSIALGGTYVGNRVGYLAALDSVGNPTAQNIVSFNGLSAQVNTIISQSDGTILVGGSPTHYSGSLKNYMVKINADGTSATGSTWNQGTGFTSTVLCFATQSDGKILAGGNFTSYSGSTNRTRILRLNTNGTLDTTFNPGTTGANGTVNTVAVQSDGKVLLGGGFTQYSGSGAPYIARANTNGTLETAATWNPGSGFNTSVNAIAVQSDGKIVAGGAFTTYSGSTKNYIVRLNTDGTADTGSSWNQGAGFTTSGVSALAIQPDGKIIAGGSFTVYSGSSATRIIRLNTDGTRDTTFNTGAGFNSNVLTIAIEPGTSKIMVGGAFTTYSGSSAIRLTRLNTDGTRDATFAPTASGYNVTINSLIPY
jgi:uncharacterized delta-60 repeat protein